MADKTPMQCVCVFFLRGESLSGESQIYLRQVDASSATSHGRASPLPPRLAAHGGDIPPFGPSLFLYTYLAR